MLKIRPKQAKKMHGKEPNQKKISIFALRLLAGLRENQYEKKDYLKLLDPKADVKVLIGPEGDFSPEEAALCVQHGYIPVSLGANRLRTETAALYAAWAPAFLKARATPC